MTRLQFAKPLNRNGGYPRRDENISSGQATRSPLNPDCPLPAPRLVRLNPPQRRLGRARVLPPRSCKLFTKYACKAPRTPNWPPEYPPIYIKCKTNEMSFTKNWTWKQILLLYLPESCYILQAIPGSSLMGKVSIFFLCVTCWSCCFIAVNSLAQRRVLRESMFYRNNKTSTMLTITESGDASLRYFVQIMNQGEE